MKKILIIDDEMQIQTLIKELLNHDDFIFEAARDGADGVARAKAVPPDLIITDLMLPKMHGFEVIRILKADPATAGIPIIVLSAKVYVPDRRKALDLGANDFLEKPFNIDELTSVIERHLAVAA